MSLKNTSKSILSITVRSSVYLCLLVLLIVLSSKGYGFGEKVFSEQGYEKKPGTDITVTIYPEDSKMDIAEKMVEKGLAGNKMVFYVQSILYEGKFIPGTYTLNSSNSAEDIIEYLSEEHEEESTVEE